MSNFFVGQLLFSRIFSCIPFFGEPSTVPESAYVSPVSEKQYYAAFDLGSGYFKVAVANMDPKNGQVIQVLFEKMIVVNLGDNFKKHGTITLEGEERALNALQELADLAKSYGGTSVKMKGVATAVFRKAGARGEEVLSHLNEVIGNQKFIKEISAEAEGEVGLKTARIVALEHNIERKIPNISWDCGNASFQVSYQTENGIKVYAGNVGNADVKALYTTDILGLPGYDLDLMTYQPISEPEMKLFLELIKEKFSDADNGLKEALIAENGHVVTIGDQYSIFSLAQSLIGKNVFTKSEVKELLDSLIDRIDTTDLEKKYTDTISYIIPLTASLYAIMDKLNINSIENYVTTGCTKGLLVTPELWED